MVKAKGPINTGAITEGVAKSHDLLGRNMEFHIYYLKSKSIRSNFMIYHLYVVNFIYMHIFNMLEHYNDTLCKDAAVKCLWEPYSCDKGKELKQQFTNALFIGLCMDRWAECNHYLGFAPLI